MRGPQSDTRTFSFTLTCLIAIGAVGLSGCELSTNDKKQFWTAFYSADVSNEELARSLERKRVSIEQVQALLSEGPEPLVRSSGPEGAGIETIRARYNQYETQYVAALPKDYSPEKTYSLVVVLHGGGESTLELEAALGTAVTYLSNTWVPFHKENTEFIALAPVSPRNWGSDGVALIKEILIEAQRNYRVDPDRIYLWGQSMGGNAAWRAGLHTPDQFAAIAPVCGGYDYGSTLKNLRNIPIYQIWGDADPHPGGLAEINQKNSETLKELGLDAVSVGVPEGGHELFSSLLPDIFEFFSTRKRNLTPRRVYASHEAEYSGGPLWVTQTDYRVWTQAMHLGSFYWVQMNEKINPYEKDGSGKNALIDVSIDANTVSVHKIENLAEVDFLFSDEMIDFEQSVRVVLSGEVLFEGKLNPSWKQVLASARSQYDRSRRYSAKLTLRMTKEGFKVQDTTLR